MFSVRTAAQQLLKTCILPRFSFASIAATPSTSALLSLRSYATDVEQRPSEINEALTRTSTLFKTYKPVTPGIRHLRRPINDHLWKGKPLKELTIPLRRTGGRNNQGRITVRGRGGGHKRRIRLVDFMRTDSGPQDVIRIEYDPGRSAHIALMRARSADANGGRRFSYILAPEGMRAGQVVESFRNGVPDDLVPGFVDKKEGRSVYQISNEKEDSADASSPISSSASLAIGLLRATTVKPGNVLPLRLIPTGTLIHCISLFPERPGILVRSAGSYGQVIAHDDKGKYTQVRLQSGEVRKVLQDCCATIGKVSNPLHRYRSLGKAGRSRWLGKRPQVRGVAMNRCVLLILEFSILC